jgi:hypothetical protein
MTKNTMEAELPGISRFAIKGHRAIDLKSINIDLSRKALPKSKFINKGQGAKPFSGRISGNKSLVQLEESILQCKRERDGVDSILKFVTIIYFVVVSVSALVGIAVLM